MRNQTKTEMEIVLEFLNKLAEAFDKGFLINKHFVLQATGVIGFAEFNLSIDRIETRLLLQQVTDISRDEYSRFCDPSEQMPNEVEHKHNEGE